GGEIALQPLSDRLALAAQPVVLALAALLFQPGVEHIPCREPWDRNHEVATSIANEALDIPLVVALAGATVAIPDQVVGQEAAEQRRSLARAVGQDLDHQATIIVVDDRLRHGPEEGERMDVAIDPRLSHRSGIGSHIAGVAMRQVEHKETGFLLDTA